MVIKVLGGGCKNCIRLAKNVELALESSSLEAVIEKVTDYNDIMAYGVMSTPALVIDEQVVSMGKILTPNQILEAIKIK